MKTPTIFLLLSGASALTAHTLYCMMLRSKDNFAAWGALSVMATGMAIWCVALAWYYSRQREANKV